MLDSDRLPIAAPSAEGRNVTLKLADCPGCKLKGRAGLLRLKPLPATVAAEMFINQSPVFVTVMICVLLVPTVTLPKSTLAGATASCRDFLFAYKGSLHEQRSKIIKSAALIRLREPRFPSIQGPWILAKRRLGTLMALASLEWAGA